MMAAVKAARDAGLPTHQVDIYETGKVKLKAVTSGPNATTPGSLRYDPSWVGRDDISVSQASVDVVNKKLPQLKDAKSADFVKETAREVGVVIGGMYEEAHHHNINRVSKPADWSKWIADYETASNKNGVPATATYAERALDEAIGTYVNDRVGLYMEASLRMQRAGRPGQETIAEVAQWYDKNMAATLGKSYGYWAGGKNGDSKYIVTDKPLSKPIRDYADQVVLKSKVSGSFAKDFGGTRGAAP
jgi:hypothetical protein